MIQIDIDMPKQCGECPLCVDYDCIIHKRVTDEYYDTLEEQYAHCPLTLPSAEKPFKLPEIYVADGYDTVVGEDGNVGFGVYVPNENYICVAGDVEGEIRARALFHEVCHWVQAMCGRPFDEDEANEFSDIVYDALPPAQPEPIKINIDDFNKEDWERLKKEWGNTPITVLPAQPDCYDADYTGGYVKEEDILKFYYVESMDDYWVGRRLDNFYYATWDTELQNFVWSKSRYLPWGEHVVAPDTLWKEHTYPSEPKEIPFADWLKGFYAKYWDGHTEADAETRLMSLDPDCKRGQWIPQDHNKVNGMTSTAVYYYPECSVCGYCAYPTNFCPNCGADMRGEQDETN